MTKTARLIARRLRAFRRQASKHQARLQAAGLGFAPEAREAFTWGIPNPAFVRAHRRLEKAEKAGFKGGV